MERDDLRITLLQAPLAWEDREANLSEFQARIEPLAGTTDLVLLPEMFTTGFTMNPAPLAEAVDGKTVQTVRRWAADYGLAVVGSYIAMEEGRYYNRAFLASPSGEVTFYNKRHLFRMAGEHLAYTAGTEQVIAEYRGWNVCLQVCYDLRFPVWSRNCRCGYDMLVYVANWPEPRASAWQPLLQARAIENQAYVAGVNRTGVDGKGIKYRGDSAVFSPKGERLVDGSDAEDAELSCTLSAAKLDSFRRKFPAWKDGDSFVFMD